MSRRPRKQQRDPNAPLRVVLYRRVSTDEQAQDGYGLDAQDSALQAEAERRGWEVVATLCDGAVHGDKPLGRRPEGAEALRLVESGEAEVLAVSKVDRLSRSALDFFSLTEQAKRQGWALVCLDLALDMTTPAGELSAGMLALFAQYERRIIGQRTREGLAAAKAKGVRLGRPSTLPAEVVARITSAREQGQTLTAIAQALNADAVPTAHGGARWHQSTVSAVLRSQAAGMVAA